MRVDGDLALRARSLLAVVGGLWVYTLERENTKARRFS